MVGGDGAVSLLRVEIWPTDGVMGVSSDAGPTIRELIDLIRSRDNHRCRPKRRRYCGAAPQLERRRLFRHQSWQDVPKLPQPPKPVAGTRWAVKFR